MKSIGLMLANGAIYAVFILKMLHEEHWTYA